MGDVIDINSNNSNKNITLIENIESIQQEFEWDCGVSCLVSVLRWLKKRTPDISDNSSNSSSNSSTSESSISITNESENQIENIKRMLNTKSVWSIDLSNVLTELGVQHRYYTNTIGVRLEHHDMEYYRNNWQTDKLRVNELFLKTMNLNPSNLQLVSSSNQLPLKYYIDHISKGLPIILLVDSCYLYCNICKNQYINENKENEKVQVNNGDDEIFCGHYIILIGYNYSSKEIIYIDPSCNQKFCTISESNIDNARMKSGTDNDSIFILNQS